MIALVARLVGARAAPFVFYGAIALALAFALWWLRHDAYGDGVRATDAKWEAASAAMQEKAFEAAAEASTKADARAIDYIEKVEQVKEKLDAAEENNTSALDVLFGGGDSGL